MTEEFILFDSSSTDRRNVLRIGLGGGLLAASVAQWRGTITYSSPPIAHILFGIGMVASGVALTDSS